MGRHPWARCCASVNCSGVLPDRGESLGSGMAVRPVEEGVAADQACVVAEFAAPLGEMLGIARRAVPYVLSMLIVVLLLAVFPALSLWAL